MTKPSRKWKPTEENIRKALSDEKKHEELEEENSTYQEEL